jgi:hypothetical protein
MLQDLVALVVQAYGGANASGSQPVLGGHIMYVSETLVLCAVRDAVRHRLGGIVFQLVAITLYTFLAAEFLIRFIKDKPIRPAEPMPVLASSDSEKGFLPTVHRLKLQGKLRQMVIGLCISTVVIFIRYILLNHRQPEYRH